MTISSLKCPMRKGRSKMEEEEEEEEEEESKFFKLLNIKTI